MLHPCNKRNGSADARDPLADVGGGPVVGAALHGARGQPNSAAALGSAVAGTLRTQRLVSPAGDSRLCSDGERGEQEPWLA